MKRFLIAAVSFLACVQLFAGGRYSDMLASVYDTNADGAVDTVYAQNGSTSAGFARFYEDSDDGTNYLTLQAQAMAANLVFTLPAADGSDGQFLKTNGSGVLAFATPAGAGDMLISVWDGDTNGAIDADAGGTNANSSAWTGFPYVTAGVWSAITLGIADGNVLTIDQADAADGEYLRLTATGAESRSTSEVKSDLSLNNVENTAISTWAGSANIATIGTVTSGTLSTGAVLADVTMTLGSDADGDIYYRASNKLTRLAKGTAGQVLAMNAGATAPGWTDGSRWKALVEDTHWNDQPASTSTITMAADLTAVLYPGLPVKFKLSGSYYYAVLTAVASDLLTIAGAPLTTGDGDLEELYYGDPEMVTQLCVYVAGTYGDGTEADLLVTDMAAPLRWYGPAMYLVSFAAAHDTVDTGDEPKVNVQLNNAAVSTNDTNAGVQLGAADTFVLNSAVAVNTSNYDVNWGEEIEVACTAAGGTGDAADLTVILTFVAK